MQENSYHLINFIFALVISFNLNLAPNCKPMKNLENWIFMSSRKQNEKVVNFHQLEWLNPTSYWWKQYLPWILNDFEIHIGI